MRKPTTAPCRPYHLAYRPKRPRPATGIPETACRAVNLAYRDPATIGVAAFAADPDTLVVPRAGEVLFRLR